MRCNRNIKYKKIYIIIIGIMFSYWLGFTVLVPGSYFGASAYDAHSVVNPNCPHIQDASEVPEGLIENIPQLNSGGFISPIEAHLLVNKLSGAVLQHVIYGMDMNLCFEYNDIYYRFVMRFAFEPYALV